MNEEAENIVLDTSGNDPAPVVDFAPLDPPLAVTPDPEPTSPSLEVISVDDLLDRLANTGEDGDTGEAPMEGTEPEEGAGAGDIITEPVVVVDTGPSNSDIALALLESIQQDVAPHPFLTTDFADYTVAEGLLVMALVLAVISFCIKMLREGFSWL